MDSSVAALIERYRDLTIQYEHAVHSTYMVYASVAPQPSASALQEWKDAVSKEEELKRQRDDVYRQLKEALAMG